MRRERRRKGRGKGGRKERKKWKGIDVHTDHLIK